MNPGRLTLNAPPPSREKAAATIQAHWRGFMVRRSKALEQLQVIYYVRHDLTAHMTVLADAAMYEKLCSDAQERLRWGECAMALLLRLDAVQGAHADVRDIRKMVTKEVITFQEIVDSTSKDASSELGLHLAAAAAAARVGFSSPSPGLDFQSEPDGKKFEIEVKRALVTPV